VAERVRELIERLRGFDYEELYRGEAALGACPRDGHEVVEGLKGYRCSKVARSRSYQLAVKSVAGKGAAAALPGRLAGLAAALGALPEVAEVAAAPKRTTATLDVLLARPLVATEGIELLTGAAADADQEGWMKACEAKALEDDGCDFTIWKEFRGRYLNRPVAERLLRERDTGPIEGFASMRGDFYAGRVLLDDELKMAFEPVKDFRGSDENGSVAPELVSYAVDDSPFVHCPRCGKGRIQETPTFFECRVPGTGKGCGVRLPRTVCKRELRRSDLLSYFDPAVGHTDWIEDFISKKDRPFTARLVLQANGRHRFEFQPRAPRGPKAGAGKGGKGGKGGKAVRKTAGAARKGGAEDRD